MDSEQLLKNIQEADNNSLRVGAANRIVQLLQKQRYSNSENSEKRWIWELCQNAKDVYNQTGKVKICIDFNADNKTVTFKHNGKAFSMDNIMSLINQSSSKDRSDKTENVSGKFGTGFITTHLLSEIVNISGILDMGTCNYSRFHITLDRTGHDKNEIVAALEKSVDQLYKCQSLSENEFNTNEFNTIFEYELDDDGIEVARQGIANLRVSAPFVLSILQDIEEISIESTKETYRYNREIECHLDNAYVHEIVYEHEEGNKNIYIMNLTEEETTISIALDYDGNKINIIPFADQQSKLFCDFPLIGTEDFPFPVLVCSREFNPTEPRDGVFLTCKSKIKVDNEIDQNRNILEKACILYEKLLRYAAKKEWGGIYNITSIKSYDKKDWYDMDWIEKIVNSCKNTVLHTPIIRTGSNSMMELQDCFDMEQVFIISERDKEMREKIWELLYRIMPEGVPCREDVHNWYNSLWRDCNKYNFKSLTKQLQDYGNIKQLQNNISEGEWQLWLSSYYDLIDENKSRQDYVISNEIKVFPNQNGVFSSVAGVYLDVDILDEYKKILIILGDDCREWLFTLELRNRDWFQLKEQDNKDILKLIDANLENASRETQNNILLQIACMYESSYDGLDEQKKICQYAIDILRTENQILGVPIVSEKLLQDALKHTITSTADRISECGGIDGFAHFINMSLGEAVSLLSEFIEFAVKHGYDNLINKSTKPILPNQNGMFMIKDDIFLDDEMDDTLKELAVDAGYDIKAELLIRDIYLELPESRQKKNIDVSLSIVQYVNRNRNSKENEVRKYFKKLLIWMCDNEERAKDIFPELYKNKHYLYDDDEIAENIKQAETLNTIMEKFNISSTEKLEEIIKRNQIQQVEEKDERIEVTEEVLLQYGIDSEEALEDAFANTSFASRFIRTSKHDTEIYEYVKSILERSKINILSYLENREGYDLSDKQKIDSTIFVIRKDGKEIYLLARPSDGGEVRIYYDTEKDILDYSMDWELWVEDGKHEPQKITFGKMIKLTGLNRIPLKGI